MEILLQQNTGTRQVTVTEGMNILEVLQQEGITSVPSPCGGNGKCLKCVVNVRGNGVNGPVLACRTPVENGLVVELEPEVKMHVQQSGKCEIYPPDEDGTGLGIACDIGTTTVVCHLMDLATGERIASVGEANAQKVFGADVIARIQAAIEGNLQKEYEAITSQLSGMIKALCTSTGRSTDEIHYMAVCGNTTMSHLFTKLDPEGIGKAPFTPVSLYGDEWDSEALDLPFKGKVYIIPCVAGYVGGDITSDVLASGMRKLEKPALMLDIGTNGEMTLGCGSVYVCCATAAGPAFEGANIRQGMPASPGAISEVTLDEEKKLQTVVLGDTAPTGVCGSGLVDALAAMLDLGALDETGRLLGADEAPEEAVPYLDEDESGNIFKLTPDGSVAITQADIRQVQLAKASIAAGIVIMARNYGLKVEDIDQIILAGGFGSYIRPRSAARIGLIPPALLGVTAAVGNAAGEGAVSAVLSKAAREDLALCQAEMKYIELSSSPEFNDAYIEEMFFPDDDI